MRDNAYGGGREGGAGLARDALDERVGGSPLVRAANRCRHSPYLIHNLQAGWQPFWRPGPAYQLHPDAIEFEPQRDVPASALQRPVACQGEGGSCLLAAGTIKVEEDTRKTLSRAVCRALAVRSPPPRSHGAARVDRRREFWSRRGLWRPLPLPQARKATPTGEGAPSIAARLLLQLHPCDGYSRPPPRPSDGPRGTRRTSTRNAGGKMADSDEGK